MVFPNWFLLNYIENNGMAFGLEIGGITGKIVLSIFRIMAVLAIAWYIVKQIKLNVPKGFVVCVSLILAGAIGNIIDSVFYGVVYRSQHLPLFQGRVIDMLYFPIVDSYFPEWFPFWKGEHFEFFRPVFNIADASISIGIISILIFQNRFFPHKEEVSATEIITEEKAQNSEDIIINTIEESSENSLNPSAESSDDEGFSEQKPTEIDTKP